MSITQSDNVKPFFGENQGVWTYLDINGKFICYVVRKEKLGKKYFIPYIKKDNEWVTQWLKDDNENSLPKPIYNVHLLKQFPDKAVLVVEGEKTADAATKLFPEFNCLSWMGGSQAIKSVDLTPLHSRRLYLLPDNDKPGYDAMEFIYNRLQTVTDSITFLDIKRLSVPEKWDVADLNDDYGEIEQEDVRSFVLDAKILPPKFKLIEKDTFPDLSIKFNPINTTDNIAFMLDFYNIKVKYNMMTNYPEFQCPGKSFSTVNEADCYFTEISNLCVKNGVPKVDLDAHINLIADRNRYHPAVDFILSKPWDGIQRINDLIRTIEADNPALAKRLMYRWLLGAVAAPFEPKGISLEGALVFQGAQFIGKTYWFLKLVPESHRFLVREGLLLDPTNKDSVMTCTSCWLGELGELDGTIRKSDIAAQKGFITKSIDSYRVPFGRRSRNVPRQTAFFGSVNPVHYLVDDTGNRRFWTVSVKSIDYNHQIDMQQVWAELKVLLDSGESYRLSAEDKILLNSENELFQNVNPLEEMLIERYRWNEAQRYNSLTVTQVLVDLGYDLKASHIKSLTKDCGAILSKLTQSKGRKSNGKMVYDLPSLKPINHYDI